MIPKPTALYRLFDVNRRLLYAGISHWPFERLDQHARRQPWWPLVYYMRYEWFESRADAAAAEMCVIRTERPRFNQTSIGGPRSRRLTPPMPVRMTEHREVVLCD